MSTHKVEVVRIESVEKHPNADRLELCKVYGFTCITQVGEFKAGDLAIYIEPDYVVPDQERYAFLNGSLRIKSRRLRKVWSQGLLLPAEPGMKHGDNVMEQLGITRYVPPEPRIPGVKGQKASVEQKVPTQLKTLPVYDLENWRKYRNLLVPGEEVLITEKLHGCNAKYAFMKGRMWCGSRNQWKRSDKLEGWDLWVEHLRTAVLMLFPFMSRWWRSRRPPKNWWWSVLETNPWMEEWCRQHPGYVLFGEVYGVQSDLRYGAKNGQLFFRAFDVYNLELETFLDSDTFCEMLPPEHRVPVLYRGPYDQDMAEELSRLKKSTIADHMAEGVVIKPLKERYVSHFGRVALKLVSDLYLEKQK